jgi:TPR repeat protein
MAVAASSVQATVTCGGSGAAAACTGVGSVSARALRHYKALMPVLGRCVEAAATGVGGEAGVDLVTDLCLPVSLELSALFSAFLGPAERIAFAGDHGSPTALAVVASGNPRSPRLSAVEWAAEHHAAFHRFAALQSAFPSSSGVERSGDGWGDARRQFGVLLALAHGPTDPETHHACGRLALAQEAGASNARCDAGAGAKRAALMWWRLAAEHGHARAMADLARLLLSEGGGARSASRRSPGLRRSRYHAGGGHSGEESGEDDGGESSDGDSENGDSNDDKDDGDDGGDDDGCGGDDVDWSWFEPLRSYEGGVRCASDAARAEATAWLRLAAASGGVEAMRSLAIVLMADALAPPLQLQRGAYHDDDDDSDSNEADDDNDTTTGTADLTFQTARGANDDASGASDEDVRRASTDHGSEEAADAVWAEGVGWLRRAADGGDGAAQLRLARLLDAEACEVEAEAEETAAAEGGAGAKVGGGAAAALRDEAEALLRRAAAQGMADAMFRLGCALLVPAAPAKEAPALQGAAGYTSSCFVPLSEAPTPAAVASREAEAAGWLERAGLEGGHVGALCRLAKLKLAGGTGGLPKDDAAGADCLRRALRCAGLQARRPRGAGSKKRRSSGNGSGNGEGLGTEAGVPSGAVEAEGDGGEASGCPEALFGLGCLAADGRGGVGGGKGAALALWRRAASEGHGDSMVLLGHMHNTGACRSPPSGGGEVDDPRAGRAAAMGYWREAAERCGDADAMCLLAGLLEAVASDEERVGWSGSGANGEGEHGKALKVVRAEARRWLEEAAARGHEGALAKLGDRSRAHAVVPATGHAAEGRRLAAKERA